MSVNTYQLVQEAREELKQVVRSREGVDKRIAELRILLRSLVRFLPDENQRLIVLREIESARRKSPSLPDAVYDVLMKNPNGMTSAQVRETLEQSGFDLDEYSQPLSAIMTALSRFVAADQVKRRIGKDKSVIFRIADFEKAQQAQELLGDK